MTDGISGCEPGGSCDSMGVAPKLKLLVGVHLVVAMVPAAGFLVPRDLRYLPLAWVMSSLSIGQLMLLSFWAGMGTSKGKQRFLGTLCGVAYVGIWPAIAQLLSPYSKRPPLMLDYLAKCSAYMMAVLLFAGIFLLIRRWSTELRRVCDAKRLVAPTRFQYSILHALVTMSVVAVVLGLARSARGTAAPVIAWQLVATGVLVIVIFSVNSVCAAWATMATGPVRLRVTLVLFVAMLLGITLSLATRQASIAWWLFPSMLLVTVLPTAVLIVSLLVVRSCGYRLAPKSKRTHPISDGVGNHSPC